MLRYLENFQGRHTGIPLLFHQFSCPRCSSSSLGKWKVTLGFGRWCLRSRMFLSASDNPQPAFGYGFYEHASMMT
jgi:hypothetical protein